MNSNFSNNLLDLRKKKGLSQKQVANDLEISQALLSHYEKGIRECGLDFVIKVCEYYDVSSDYLLGITTKENPVKSTKDKSSQEKLILSSIDIIFVIAKNINSKNLLNEICNYLNSAVYTIFRNISSSNELYSIDEDVYSPIASSNMTMNKARIRMILKNEKLNDKLPRLNKDTRKYTDFKKLISVVEEKMKEEN